MDNKNNRKKLYEYNNVLKSIDDCYRNIAKRYGFSEAAFWTLYTLRMEPGIRLGIKYTVRNRLVPLMPRVSTRAMAKAHTLMSTVLTTVKTAVKPKAWRKVESWNTER